MSLEHREHQCSAVQTTAVIKARLSDYYSVNDFIIKIYKMSFDFILRPAVVNDTANVEQENIFVSNNMHFIFLMK